MTAAESTTRHEHAVLVVEDSDIGRESLALLLKMEGYRPVTAPTGLEAFHLLHTLRLRPCVVVTDLIMAKMDGLTFRDELLKHPELSAIPVIALTGHEGLRRYALDKGFAAGLLKPCDINELLRLIDQHCCRRAVLHVERRA